MIKGYIRYFVIGVILGLGLIVILKISKNYSENNLTEIKNVSFKSENVFVVKALDGDTLELKDGRKVRLIGVDTPELHHPELPVQYFASEAGEYTKKLCEGQNVTLEFENELTDKYERLLAYVLLPDGTYLNEDLLKRGYGYTYTRFPFSKMDSYLSLEHEARANQRGIHLLMQE